MYARDTSPLEPDDVLMGTLNRHDGKWNLYVPSGAYDEWCDNPSTARVGEDAHRQITKHGVCKMSKEYIPFVIDASRDKVVLESGEDIHLYKFGNGIPIPNATGVSTLKKFVFGEFDVEEVSSLCAARSKVKKTKEEFQRDWKLNQKKGSDVHDKIEKFFDTSEYTKESKQIFSPPPIPYKQPKKHISGLSIKHDQPTYGAEDQFQGAFINNFLADLKKCGGKIEYMRSEISSHYNGICGTADGVAYVHMAIDPKRCVVVPFGTPGAEEIDEYVILEWKTRTKIPSDLFKNKNEDAGACGEFKFNATEKHLLLPRSAKIGRFKPRLQPPPGISKDRARFLHQSVYNCPSESITDEMQDPTWTGAVEVSIDDSDDVLEDEYEDDSTLPGEDGRLQAHIVSSIYSEYEFQVSMYSWLLEHSTIGCSLPGLIVVFFAVRSTSDSRKEAPFSFYYRIYKSSKIVRSYWYSWITNCQRKLKQ